MARKFNDVWRKKACCLGVLTIFKQALAKHYENPSESFDFEGFNVEQGTGIEPASSAWEADVLPMY